MDMQRSPKPSHTGSNPVMPVFIGCKSYIWVSSLAAKAADCKSATKKHRWFESNPLYFLY